MGSLTNCNIVILLLQDARKNYLMEICRENFEMIQNVVIVTYKLFKTIYYFLESFSNFDVWARMTKNSYIIFPSVHKCLCSLNQLRWNFVLVDNKLTYATDKTDSLAHILQDLWNEYKSIFKLEYDAVKNCLKEKIKYMIQVKDVISLKHKRKKMNVIIPPRKKEGELNSQNCIPNLEKKFAISNLLIFRTNHRKPASLMDVVNSNIDPFLLSAKRLSLGEIVPDCAGQDIRDIREFQDCQFLKTLLGVGPLIQYNNYIDYDQTKSKIYMTNLYSVAPDIFMHLVYDNRTMPEGDEEEISNDAFHFDGFGSICKFILFDGQYTIEGLREFQYFEKADTKDGKALADKDEKIKERNQRHKSTEASEGSANQPIHHTDICSDDHCTTFDSQEDNSTGMPVSMINENLSNIQDNQILSSEVNTDISSDESWSTVESTLIRLYENVIRNETSRMMSSIGIEAEHLFGLERSQIFFDLLDEELCHFGLAGALIDSVPNMAESTVRQNVISFFEHAVNRLMTVLLTCLDSKILQQMPVQNFISLMKSVIKSSLKAETKGREKLSLEGNIYTMVDPMDFERAQGEEIPEDVLDRLRNEDEMVEYSFLDTRLEIHQPSGRIENMPIDSVYYPSVFRLSPYIPTANGCYWHQSDMWRADGISQHGSMVNENVCKVQDQQIPSSEANTDASSDKSWSTFESTLIRLYRNATRNETSRMMSSIDMVGFKAERLFGLERSRIFFDLLDEELCNFGSAGAISEFVPNMAESTVRQHVISFFEHANDTMSRLMTLLLSCPDSKILQQMPVQNFISLMKSVIKSSLKAQTKGREKLYFKGNIYTMVDPKDFERALGEEIPEDILNRLRSEDEMVVHRFVGNRLGCIYFPSDCRLFISIPTETGSYWHRLDMWRANRIRRHSI